MSWALEKINSILNRLRFLKFAFFSLVFAADDSIQISEKDLGFKIPNFAKILTALIRFFFVIAGVSVLFMLLTGALAWINSGGNKESVEKARDRLTNAITGIILIVVVLSIMWSLENLVFQKRLCFGISCPVTIPKLLEPPGGTPNSGSSGSGGGGGNDVE